MHQLFAKFIQDTPVAAEDQPTLQQIATTQAARFKELAQGVWSNPANLEDVTLFLSYPLTPELWASRGVSFTLTMEVVGDALIEVGRFQQARPWFECAIAEKEKGDADGRIDHQSLGTSLHWVGYCHSSIGQFNDARPWFERAVAQAEQGDIHGRIDHENVAVSMEALADCYAKTGQPKEAQSWRQRAEAERQKAPPPSADTQTNTASAS
jgi:tetratricopeptide (TPR) repeat protein